MLLTKAAQWFFLKECFISFEMEVLNTLTTHAIGGETILSTIKRKSKVKTSFGVLIKEKTKKYVRKRADRLEQEGEKNKKLKELWGRRG